jgi:hypothetical protein
MLYEAISNLAVGCIGGEKKRLRISEVHVQDFGITFRPRTKKSDIAASRIDLHDGTRGECVGSDWERWIVGHGNPERIHSWIGADRSGDAQLDSETVGVRHPERPSVVCRVNE